MSPEIRQRLLCCVAVALGLAGAALFVYNYPDWFLEMMILLGPWLAAGVSAVIALLFLIVAGVPWQPKLVTFFVAGAVAFVLIFWWAQENQNILKLLYYGRLDGGW